MYMKIIGNFFQYIENLVSKGDKYYGKMLLISHLFNALYIVLFSVFGISLVQNQLMRSFNTSIQMVICILLLVKFNPFREHTLAHSDSNLIFNAAVFLFFNLGIIETMNRIKQTISNRVVSTVDNMNKKFNHVQEAVENPDTTELPQHEPYM